MLANPSLADLEEAGLLQAIESQSRAEYPNECCGLIIEKDGRLQRIACENLQDKMLAEHPGEFTRTAATAYFMAPKVILEHAESIRCIYHSHPDHGAYFSDEDQLVAAPFGEPNFPGVSYLVVSVMAGEVEDKKVFTWSDSSEQFESAGANG